MEHAYTPRFAACFYRFWTSHDSDVEHPHLDLWIITWICLGNLPFFNGENQPFGKLMEIYTYGIYVVFVEPFKQIPDYIYI